MATLSEALAIALQHHQADRLPAAEQIYRRILAVEPNHADAIHLLGVIARQVGKYDVAVELIGRAIGLKGNVAAFHVNLGIAFAKQGRHDEAVVCYRRALELSPDFAAAHYNLGGALKEMGKLDQAVACYRRALELKPDFVEAYYNLGNALKERGELDEAVACYRQAVELKPDFAEAHNNLGVALTDQGKLNGAVVSYRRAVERKPDFTEAHINLGGALKEQGKLDEAVACYRRVLELNPDYAEAHNNLGSVFKDQGNLGEAIVCYRRALELNQGFAVGHSNLVYTQMFCPEYDARTIYEEHCRWNQCHASPLVPSIQPHLNDRSPDRRLRIGYVSPDFRRHPVGQFLLPLLESHDRRHFEILCYASVEVADTMTDHCRARTDVWRDVLRLSDEQLANAIRQDQVDILVDLTMHMAKNRLLVFARKPAPVQVTYLGYCGTTGLSTMDYRLTDPYLDPPGRDERIYSEQSVWLSETYWCYRLMVEAPPVNALPVLATGHVSFGSLNNFCKATPPTLAAWSRLLQDVPESTLLLHAHPGSHRDRVRTFLTEQGVSPERVAFIDFKPIGEYFRAYQQIDVALDPFPYGGGTTTCDALWMGVPVVSLAGQTAVGRGGFSILSNIGLPELVAPDPEQYVRIAVELARDIPRLGNLRATLRQRMQGSPLLDAPRFAGNIESAYREMWRQWCAKSESVPRAEPMSRLPEG